MGYSRDTFYRYKELKEEGGVDVLYEVSRRRANLKNRIDEKIEDAVVKMAHDYCQVFWDVPEQTCCIYKIHSSGPVHCSHANKTSISSSSFVI